MKKIYLSIFVVVLSFVSVAAMAQALTLDQIKMKKVKSELMSKCSSSSKTALQGVDVSGKSFDLFINRPAVQAALKELGIDNKTGQLKAAKSESEVAAIIATGKATVVPAVTSETETTDAAANTETESENPPQTDGEGTTAATDDQKTVIEEDGGDDVTTQVLANNETAEDGEELVDEDDPRNDTQSGGIGILGAIITSLIVSIIVSIVIVLLYNNTHKQMHYGEQNSTAKQQQQITMLSNRISQLENKLQQ